MSNLAQELSAAYKELIEKCTSCKVLEITRIVEVRVQNERKVVILYFLDENKLPQVYTWVGTFFQLIDYLQWSTRY